MSGLYLSVYMGEAAFYRGLAEAPYRESSGILG